LEIHVEYTPAQVVSEYLRHRFSDECGAVHGILYNSAKSSEGVNAALFIESGEIEGVATEWWKPKQAVLQLIGREDVIVERERAREEVCISLCIGEMK
jgi:hypothetical protein